MAKVKLTQAQRRATLDVAVLRALNGRDDMMTYVIRNVVDWPGQPLHRSGIGTADVLRSCRRLEQIGRVEAARSSYAIQKAWRITPAGRAALQEAGQ